MNPEVTAAIIASGGVIISLVVSIYSSRKISNTEIRKVRTSSRQSYASKLLEKRLEVYPGLYSLISKASEDLWKGIVNKTYLEEYLEKASNWGFQNSIFLSGKSTRQAYELGKFIRDLVNHKSADEVSTYLANQKNVKLLSREIEKLENYLKTDMGIYLVEFHQDEEHIIFEKYQDITKKLRSPQK